MACTVSPADLCMSPNGGCEERLVTHLLAAQKTLDIAVYALDSEAVTDAVRLARLRGLRVRLLVDTLQSRRLAMGRQVDRLRVAGVLVRYQSGTRSMHLKLAVVDHSLVMLGSYNYTSAADKKNDEVLLEAHCPSVAERLSREFELRWARGRLALP